MSAQDIPSTDLMSLREWADAVALALDDSGLVGRLDDEARWQDWAAGVVALTSVSITAAPNPYDFKQWNEWAERLLQTIGG